MFHQLSVGEAGVRLQDHEGNLSRRAEDVPASQSLFRQAHNLCHTLKREHRMKSAKLTLMKTLAIFFYNIKFCKAQSRVNFRNILYLSHIFVGEFPPFWLLNLIWGVCRSAALLPLPPLRTVRATFTAYSSDNSKFNSHEIKPALSMTCFQ